MTQQINSENEVEQRRRGRGPTKPFPTMTFEDALVLPKSILEYGVNGKIQRLTLLGKLNRPPDSSMTRSLISNSHKYGLTVGNYNTQSLEVTDDGRLASRVEQPTIEARAKLLQFAIGQFEPFSKLYEKLKDHRLPDKAVLKDELGRVNVADSDRDKVAEVFTANLRFLGLVHEVAGNDYVKTIEQAAAEMPANSEPPPEPSSIESPVGTATTVEENRKTAVATNRPALHIDIQVHIDPTSSAEQIDHIFASMAKYLYGNES